MKKTMSALTFAILGIVMVAGLASAFQGNFETGQLRLADDETRNALDQSFENNDYSAWYEIVSKQNKAHKISEYITEENFEVFADMHEAAMNGDMETAKELREALGFPGFRQGRNKDFRPNSREKHLGGDCNCASE